MRTAPRFTNSRSSVRRWTCQAVTSHGPSATWKTWSTTPSSRRQSERKISVRSPRPFWTLRTSRTRTPSIVFWTGVQSGRTDWPSLRAPGRNPSARVNVDARRPPDGERYVARNPTRLRCRIEVTSRPQREGAIIRNPNESGTGLPWHRSRLRFRGGPRVLLVGVAPRHLQQLPPQVLLFLLRGPRRPRGPSPQAALRVAPLGGQR